MHKIYINLVSPRTFYVLQRYKNREVVRYQLVTSEAISPLG